MLSVQKAFFRLQFVCFVQFWCFVEVLKFKESSSQGCDIKQVGPECQVQDVSWKRMDLRSRWQGLALKRVH